MGPFVMDVSPAGSVARRELSGVVPTWVVVGGTLLGSWVLGIPMVLPAGAFVAHYAFGLGWGWAIAAGFGATMLLELLAQAMFKS